MAKELVLNYRDVFRSIAFHLNAINEALGMKVDSTNYNTAITNIQSEIYNFQTTINNFEVQFELWDGMHFVADQTAQKLLLKNANGNVITEISVAWLNNEGTTFTFNANTNNLELRNDAGELLSSIPVSSFVSNMGNVLNFNSINKYILELKDNNGVIKSSVEINIENVKNLQQTINAIQTLYNNDGVLSANRTVLINDKYLKFQSSGDIFELYQNKLTIPSLHTNKFGVSQETGLIIPTLVSNIPYLEIGNSSIEKLTHNAKNHNFKNVKVNDGSGTKTLIINDNGDLMVTTGLAQSYIAGDGITINGNVISLTPADSIELIFEW